MKSEHKAKGAETEAAIETELRSQVGKLGGMCLKWSSPGARGVPDRVCLLPGGKIVAVELKTARGVVSALQDRMHVRLRALGMDVRVVRSRADARALVQEFNAGGHNGG
jgi:hypothetical protein